MNETNAEPRFLPYRPLVPVAAAFAGGIAARELLVLPPSLAWGLAAVAVAAFPVFRVLGPPRLGLATLYLLVILAGWLRLDADRGELPEHHIARLAGERPALAKIRGIVASDPQAYSVAGAPLTDAREWLASPRRQTRLELDVSQVLVDNREWRSACGRALVVFHAQPGDIRYGDDVAVLGSLFRPQPPSNPGQIDGEKLLRRRGIHAVMTVDPGNLEVRGHHRGGLPKTIAYAARGWLRHRLREDFAASPRTASLLCATVLGDKTALDDDGLDESLKRTGTMHLLAISGLHVGVVAWMVWAVTSLIGLSRERSGAVVLGAVALYATLTGMPPSVARATLMVGVLVVSILGRRQTDPLHVTAFAALVLLVVNPSDLFQAGFQLSFAAVIAIVCLCDEIACALQPRDSIASRMVTVSEMSGKQRAWLWLRRRLALSSGVSGAAWLGILPLAAYYFNLFSPITLIVNLVAVPLLGLVLVLGFVHTAFAVVSTTLASAPGLLAQGATAGLGWVVSAGALVPRGWTYCATPALGWVAGYYALGAIVLVRRRIGLSGRLAMGMWGAGILTYAAATLTPPRPRGMEATVLDVGHGSAVVLRYPDGSTVLCDCGSYARGDVGQWVAARALWHWGVRRIDLILVSHTDTDHVNGIPSLLERFPVGRVLYSPIVETSDVGRQLMAMLKKRGIPHGSVRAGDRIVVGDANVLEILVPLEATMCLKKGDQNENSLVVRAEHEGRRILLGGDIQHVASTVLLHAGVDLAADVLVVPHHGRAMDTAGPFARAIHPAFAICSSDEEHLSPETLAQYETAGAKVLTTCREGAITVRIRGGEMEVERWGRGRTITRDP